MTSCNSWQQKLFVIALLYWCMLLLIENRPHDYFMRAKRVFSGTFPCLFLPAPSSHQSYFPSVFPASRKFPHFGTLELKPAVSRPCDLHPHHKVLLTTSHNSQIFVRLKGVVSSWSWNYSFIFILFIFREKHWSSLVDL